MITNPPTYTPTDMGITNPPTYTPTDMGNQPTNLYSYRHG